MFGFFKRWRRRKLANELFPQGWTEIIERNLPVYKRLSTEDRTTLLRKVHVFLEEKRFEACGGLEMTDEIRVTIAAQACLLLLNLPENFYPGLRSILVYPGAYLVRSKGVGAHDHVVQDGEQTRLGESWTTGSVVLSWNASKQGGATPNDGNNVVFHEFAHQLDQEDGAGDGAPILGKQASLTERRSMYVSWARVLQSEFDHLQFQARHGKRSLLDHYGATNPAEFFAVATECFFEKPRLMRKRHPELYQELSIYFHQDPASWLKARDDEDDDA